MPDRPTLRHVRITALELNGRSVQITSAELVEIQYWRGDHAAQLDWEIGGRTASLDHLHQGPQSVVMTVDGRLRKGRVVLSSSTSFGFTKFEASGLGELTDIEPTPAGL